MRSSCASLIGLLVVALSPAVADAQPASAPPTWPGHVDGGAVQVDALDVDADVLRAALVPAGAAYVTIPSGKTVTGRVRVAKRAHALAALIAHEPTLAVASRPMRGGGPRLDLEFTAAPTADLYRLLADVLRTNIVVLAPSTNLTIRARRKPAGGVLAEVARASGAAIDRPARNVVVVRPASAPPITRLPTGGATLRLAARQILAGHLVELIRALDGPRSPTDVLRDAALACGSGQPVDLSLKQVATATALGIVERIGAVNLRGPRCALPPLAQDPTVDLKLLATVERGGARLAAVELGGDAYLVAPGGAWSIGDAWIAHRGSGGERHWRLYPSLGATAGAAPGATPPRQARLAATVIDGRARLAIVELDGGFRVWTDGRPVVTDAGERLDVTVAPGEVQLGATTLRLTPRVP